MSHLRDDDAGKRAVIRQFRASGRKTWPVLESRPADAVADVRHFLDEDGREFDYVLFDLPGTLATGGVLRLVSSIEHLFIPVKADRMVLESAITFARMVCETFVASERIATQSVHLFWTMIDRRERTALFDRYDALFDEFGLPCLGTRIPRRARFSHEAASEGGAPFRSTLLPADAALARDARTDALAREILSILER